MKIQPDSDALIFFTVPWKMWLSGAGCMALSAFFITKDFSAYIEMWRAEISDPVILMAAALPVMAGTGLFLCLTLPTVRVVMDEHAGRLQITRKSVLRKNVETVPFNHIASIDARASALSDENDDLEVFITLRNETEIVLNSAPIGAMRAAPVVDALRRATGI